MVKVNKDHIIKVFKYWEFDIRLNPELFSSKVEVDNLSCDEIGELRAQVFYDYLEAVMKGLYDG